MNRTPIRWVAGAVAWLAILAYWPCIRNGFTQWDDNVYVQGAAANDLWWALTTTHVYYHPLTRLSHYLDWKLWGPNPAGHHAVNVVLHAANAALVVLLAWAIAQRLDRWPERERYFFAGWVGLIFAIHPLQVESVAWIAERKNLLCGFFSLLALLLYVRGQWWPMLGAYTAALLSKPMAVPLPLVMMALDYFPLGRRGGKILTEKWLLFVLAGILCVLTLWPQHDIGALRTHQLGLIERLLIAARSLVFYLWKLAWPAWLSPFYPLGDELRLWQAEFLVPPVLCVAITIGVWRRPALRAAWLAYVALVLPVSGLFQAGGQAVADRFAYLAMVPVWLVAGAALRRVWVPVLVAYAAWLVVRTEQQIPVWHDDVALWSTVRKYYPQSRAACRMLTHGLVAQGRFEEAIPYAEPAMESVGSDPERQWLGADFEAMTEWLVEQRRFADAVPMARRAVELRPDNLPARSLLGLALLKTGAFAEAAEQLKDVNLPAARYNLACAYARLGRLEDARSALAGAVALEPKFAELATRDPELASLRE
jgi:tetratricopeptide (TPR) repeat protein